MPSANATRAEIHAAPRWQWRALVNTQPRPACRSWLSGQLWRFLPACILPAFGIYHSPRMASKKPQPTKPALYKRLIMLSEDSREHLERLAQECSDQLGMTISQAAVVRGLVRASIQQPVAALVKAVEAELATGTLWGSRPKKKGGEQKT